MHDLKVNNLFFSYAQKDILKEITFVVDPGEFIGLVGPNGSGKTTLLNCITRALVPRKGQVILRNKNLKDFSTKEIAKRIAVVPQGGSVEFDFNVREIVLMGRHPHQNKFTFETKADGRIVESSMKLTKVWSFRDTSIQHLSGGEFQRVLIARALAQDPSILLLDEPTAHLDINHQLEIMDIMAHLNTNKKLTVIGVFHDLNLAARYCQRLLILHRGRLYADGPIEKVLTTETLFRIFHINSIIRRNPMTNNLFIDPIATVDSSIVTDVANDTGEKDIAINMNQNNVKGKKEPHKKIHIICGAGTGSVLMKMLWEEGFDITAGVLNVLDQDHHTADTLKIPVVREAAFSPISKKSYKKNLEFISKADVIILMNAPFGSANLKNISVLDTLSGTKKKIILFEPTADDISKRDFTKGEATRIYQNLRSKSIISHSPIEILKILRESNNSEKSKKDK